MTSPWTMDEALCARLMMTLVHFLWQGAAIALVVLPAGLVLRRAAANTRYVVMLGALLIMAACPLGTFVWLGGGQDAAILAAAAASRPPRLARPAFQADLKDRPVAAGAPDQGNVSGEAETQVPARVRAEPLPILPVVQPIAPPAKTEVLTGWRSLLLDRQKWLPYAPYIVAAYGAGVAVTLGRLLLGLYGGGRLRRRSQPVEQGGLLAALGRQARVLGLHVTPAIAFCGQVAVPTVVGVLRPTILLPLAIVSGMTVQQVETLLTHELAHIRRYDHIANIVQRLIEAFLFFHPAMWLISRRIRIERELCCDDWVVRAGCTPLAYADSLVRVAELCTMHLRSPAAAAALAAADRSSQLRSRVLRLLGMQSNEPVRLAHAWPGVVVLAAVAVLVTCHHLGAATPGKYLEGDAALLKKVAAAHKANREAIRTWKGSLTVEHKTWLAGAEGSEPKTVSTVTGEFVIDAKGDRQRWNVVTGAEEGPSSTILDGVDVYHLRSEQRGERRLLAGFRTQFADRLGVMDLMSMLSKPCHQDIETQLLREYARATEPVSAKDKDAADVTGEVKRDEDRIVLTLSTRDYKTKSLFDMTKGGNLVSFDRDGPKQSESIRIKYEQCGGAWVPATFELTNVDRVEGVATNANVQRLVFAGQVVNAPVADADFDLARIGLQAGDSVNDLRSGGVSFTYGQPFSKPKDGATVASWVARKRSAAPVQELSGWRTMVSGGGFVELLGLARSQQQGDYTFLEWWLPNGTPVDACIQAGGKEAGEAVAAFRITAPADALRGWAVAGGNRVPLRTAHHLAVSDMWVVTFDLPADAEQVQFELELGTNPKELFRVPLTAEQLKGDARIGRNGLEKVAEFKRHGWVGMQMDVLHKPRLPGDRFMILADGRAMPAFSTETEAAKEGRQVTRMVVPAQDVEGLVRQELQWHAVTIRAAAGKQQVYKPQEAAEQAREQAALAAAGDPNAVEAAPASEPSNEPPGPPNLFFEKFPAEQAEYFSIQGSPNLTVVDPVPEFCKSEQPLLLHTPTGTFGARMLFDESGGTGSGYDTMYVDCNNNGDYLDDPVYRAGPIENPKGPDGARVAAYFPNVRVRRLGPQGWSCLLQVFLEKNGYGGGAELKCCFIPQNWAVGNVQVGERTMRAALADGNWNDTVTDVGGLALDRFPNTNYSNPVRADNLVLGLDGEDRIIPGSVHGGRGTVRVFLARNLVLDSGIYQVRAVPSGEGIRLDLLPTRANTGQLPLDEKARAARLSLFGTHTAVVLTNPGAVVELPADTYYGPTFEQSLYAVRAGDVAEVPAPDPTTAVSGVVLKPSGGPAAGAQVTLAEESGYVYVSNGQPSGQGNPFTKTDAAGKFTLSRTPEDYMLVVVHEAGWAELPRQQFESGTPITLQAWARVEGVLMRGSKPWAGEEIQANLRVQPASRYRLYYGYQATTDKNGRFVVERLVPTKAEIWHEAANAEVDPKPGQTVQVTLGGKGRPVLGRITGPGGERISRMGLADSGRLFTPQRVPEPPHPDGWDKMTAEQRQVYVQAWLKSPEGRKAVQAMAGKPRGAWFAVQRNGSFRIENVEPGTYDLDVSILERSPDGKAANKVVAKVHATVEVAAGSLDEPVNVGTIRAERTPEPAPASRPSVASQPAASRPVTESVTASE